MRVRRLRERERDGARPRPKASATRGAGDDAIPVASIPARPGALSHTQRRMWFLAQLDPASVAYNEWRIHRLTGRLNAGALERALHCVVNRHDALRTTFEDEQGEPKAVVHGDGFVDFRILDAAQLVDGHSEASLVALLEREAQVPFDLGRDALVRVRLVRIDAEHHLLMRVLHHIVTDGWSNGVLEREWSRAYAMLAAGKQPDLPPLPAQYADFVRWSEERAESGALVPALAYWTSALKDLSTLELATDRTRPAVPGMRGALFFQRLPSELARGLARIARSNGATLFMVTLAAFKVLLARYSRQVDIAVGTQIAARHRPEFEPLIGFFANTLVLRTDLDGNPSFTDLLQRVRSHTLAAFDHQGMPFEKLVEVLAPVRDPSRNPLFQVGFALRDSRAGNSLDFADMTVERLPRQASMAKFDLNATVTPRADCLEVEWGYATDLFDAVTIEAMAEHYRVLLEAVVADPGCEIGRLPLFTAEERHRLLTQWNDTAAPYPRESSLNELIDAQCARSPHAVAVRCGAAVYSLMPGFVRARTGSPACWRRRESAPGIVLRYAWSAAWSSSSH